MSDANSIKTTAKSSTKSGSPVQGEPDFLVIGQIIKPHGVRGEVVVDVMTDFPERFTTMKQVSVGNKGHQQSYKLLSTRWHKGKILMQLQAINNRSQAETLRGLYLQIPISEAMPLDEDTFYIHELLGLTVITDTDEILGKLTDVLETGANDVYVVQNDQQELLLPAIKEVILNVDLESQTLTVHLLDGLI